METLRPWPEPTPLCATGRLEKRPDRGEERKSEGKKTQEETAKGRRYWIGDGDEEGGDRGEPKRQGGKERERESELVGSVDALKLVRSQSRVLGMKTGRAVCHSQARDSTLPENSSFFHPNLHSHLLPSPSIHQPIHQPLCSTSWPPLLEATTLSKRPDGLDEIRPSYINIHLNRCNAPTLLGYFISLHSFTKVSRTRTLQSHFKQSCYEAMRRSWHTEEKTL